MLTWQINSEWWGKHAIAHHKDYRLDIQKMDGVCFWYIREDQKVKARGSVRCELDKAQQMVATKLRHIKVKDFFRRDKYVTSAA